MIISNEPQGSEEWVKSRLGRITASEAHKLMGKAKSKTEPFGEGALTYIYSVAAEILSGMTKSNIDGVFALEHGKSKEPAARSSFELQTGFSVSEVGFIIGEDRDNSLGDMCSYLGFSADGMIFDKKIGVEIKCPLNSDVYLKFLCAEKLKKEYYCQVQFSMLISGFEQWYMVQYDDRICDNPVYWKIIERDEEYIEKLKERCFLAIEAIKHIVKRVRG